MAFSISVGKKNNASSPLLRYDDYENRKARFYMLPKKAHSFPIDGAVAPRMDDDDMNYQYYDFESERWCTRKSLKSPYYVTDISRRPYLSAWTLLTKGGF